ncbi:MAG: hypothetical protein WBZ29_01475 [Methanocella sp.]
MSKSKPLIKSILNGERRGCDHTMPANDEAADDVRLLHEIAFQMEQEKVSGSFDSTCPGEHKPCPFVEKDDDRHGVKKRPVPKHNKALKEAEQAALQKPLTAKMYRQIIKDHMEILPLVYKKMDKNNSS